MKKYPVLLLLGMTLLVSCQSKEDKAKNVVDEFLTEINDQTKTMNEKLMTENFYSFFHEKSYYTTKNWSLTTKPENDSTLIVESKANTSDGTGTPIEHVQKFRLTNKSGIWKIYDSYKLVADEIDFEVVDTEWDFYWDRDKDYFLKEFQDKLKLKIVIPGHIHVSDFRIGTIKIINDSDFDIKNLNILIEHFDNEGTSVNTHHQYVTDIIRNHAYREVNWGTFDCAKCYKQKFKINFIKESH